MKRYVPVAVLLCSYLYRFHYTLPNMCATKKASAMSFNNKGASTVQVTCEFCQETYQFEEDDVLAAV